LLDSFEYRDVLRRLLRLVAVGNGPALFGHEFARKQVMDQFVLLNQLVVDVANPCGDVGSAAPPS
jgi:hypothetical protein